MLALTRLPGTSLEFTIEPSTEVRQMVIHFRGDGRVAIHAPRSIEVIRDDAINRKEKSCTGSTVSGS